MTKPQTIRFDKISTLQGYMITTSVAFILGLAFWLLYKWAPDLLPFAIAWVIVRPVFKIHQHLDREMNL